MRTSNGGTPLPQPISVKGISPEAPSTPDLGVGDLSEEVILFDEKWFRFITWDS